MIGFIIVTQSVSREAKNNGAELCRFVKFHIERSIKHGRDNASLVCIIYKGKGYYTPNATCASCAFHAQEMREDVLEHVNDRINDMMSEVRQRIGTEKEVMNKENKYNDKR